MAETLQIAVSGISADIISEAARIPEVKSSFGIRWSRKKGLLSGKLDMETA